MMYSILEVEALILWLVLPIFLLIGALEGIRLRHREVNLHNKLAVKKSTLLTGLKWIFRFSVIPLGLLTLQGDFLWILPPVFAHYFKETLIIFYGGILICLAGAMIGNSVRGSVTQLRVSLITLLAYILICYCMFYVPYPVYQELSRIENDGVIFQSSSHSCVPASLANIVRYHRQNISEQGLAVLLKTSTFGTHLSSLEYICPSLGFYAKRSLVKYADLQGINYALVTVDHPQTGPDSHAVVLVSASIDTVHLIDPLQGRLKMSAEDFQEIWHGQVVTIDKISPKIERDRTS